MYIAKWKKPFWKDMYHVGFQVYEILEKENSDSKMIRITRSKP
jgi:hypothetical protein